MAEQGRYIVIEGSDGTGKTTVADNLAQHLRQQGREVLRVDEPDSAYSNSGELLVPVSAELRAIIKNGQLGRSALKNVLLFHSQRIENWEQASLPALERGADVVSARNYWSTLIYQGYGEGFDTQRIIDLTTQDLGERYMNPDIAVILDVEDEDERQRRILGRGPLENPDPFESQGADFQQRLRDGYKHLAQEHSIQRIMTDQSKRAVAAAVIRAVEQGSR